ncbi:MAG: phosphotransferase [Desulfomonilaceae bacterium]
MELETINKSLTTMLQIPGIGLKKLGGGRNSVVYKVSCPDNVEYAAKIYFSDKVDTRNRLKTEFESLSFLWRNGFRNVPQPIASDKKMGIAIYEYVKGGSATLCQLDEADIEQASKFLSDLYEAREYCDSEKLPDASEAFFSLDAILNNIKFRLGRLQQIEHETANIEFERFLRHQLIPALDTVELWARNTADSYDIEAHKQIPRESRTLSPSDFGFHNAIKRRDGLIVFLDFEYFGWDDPAKMISDFLLHPAMSIPHKLMRQFVKSIVPGLGDAAFLNRTKIVYPLYGLKWCLILLNEFLPDQLARREFAGVTVESRTKLQEKQLDKARSMLKRVLNEYEEFADIYC